MKIIAALICALAFGTVSAMDIRPLATVWPDGHRSGVLRLTNSTKTEKTYQVFVDEWIVENGEQVRRPSSDLLLVPSLVKVQPGAQQTIRYSLKGKGPGERAFRIKVRELPPPVITRSGVHFLPESDFPWFWRPEGLAPNLSARWEGNELLIRNTGSATAQLVNLEAGATTRLGLVQYVLPGAEVRLPVKIAAPVPSIKVRVNGKDQTLGVQ